MGSLLRYTHCNKKEPSKTVTNVKVIATHPEKKYRRFDNLLFNRQLKVKDRNTCHNTQKYG